MSNAENLLVESHPSIAFPELRDAADDLGLRSEHGITARQLELACDYFERNPNKESVRIIALLRSLRAEAKDFGLSPRTMLFFRQPLCQAAFIILFAGQAPFSAIARILTPFASKLSPELQQSRQLPDALFFIVVSVCALLMLLAGLNAPIVALLGTLIVLSHFVCRQLPKTIWLAVSSEILRSEDSPFTSFFSRRAELCNELLRIAKRRERQVRNPVRSRAAIIRAPHVRLVSDAELSSSE